MTGEPNDQHYSLKTRSSMNRTISTGEGQTKHSMTHRQERSLHALQHIGVLLHMHCNTGYIKYKFPRGRGGGEFRTRVAQITRAKNEATLLTGVTGHSLWV